MSIYKKSVIAVSLCTDVMGSIVLEMGNFRSHAKIHCLYINNCTCSRDVYVRGILPHSREHKLPKMQKKLTCKEFSRGRFTFLKRHSVITHLVSDELQVAEQALDNGERTPLLMKLKEQQKQPVRRQLCDSPLRGAVKISRPTVPFSLRRKSSPHNRDRTRVSFGTRRFGAPRGGSFSPPAGTVSKAQWQTDTAPSDSGGDKTMQFVLHCGTKSGPIPSSTQDRLQFHYLASDAGFFVQSERRCRN